MCEIISIGKKEVNISTFLDNYHTRKCLTINEFGSIQMCNHPWGTESTETIYGETISFSKKHYFVFNKKQILVSYSMTDLMEYILEKRKTMEKENKNE